NPGTWAALAVGVSPGTAHPAGSHLHSVAVRPGRSDPIPTHARRQGDGDAFGRRRSVSAANRSGCDTGYAGQTGCSETLLALCRRIRTAQKCVRTSGRIRPAETVPPG